MARFARLDRDAVGPVPDEVISVSSTGALVSVLSWWVTNDFPLRPETMAEQVTSLLGRGTRAAAGLH
ncbi:TetR-like C-terminal domain-containing protein [Actinomadura sp. 21ATH]|uniref:TetR-like C-terminal domain-containing protein n=1 Tax=Actinomadura sp. 21ATH TaxID=1735444 RepID=UPI0035BFBF5F